MAERWREWSLIWYATEERPPEKPPKEAELSADGAWASLYRGDRIVAAWMRYRKTSREALAAATEARRGREAARSTSTARAAKLES